METKMNLRSVTDLQLTWQRMRMVICLQILIVYWTVWRITSLNYWMYMGLTG